MSEAERDRLYSAAVLQIQAVIDRIANARLVR